MAQISFEIDQNTPINKLYICMQCGIQFTVIAGRRRMYCSDLCRNRGSRHRRHHPNNVAFVSPEVVTLNNILNNVTPRGAKIGAGYVYIIGNSYRAGPVKIGKSISPNKRLSDIQTGNPQTLRILASVYSDNADELEAQIHTRFQLHNVSGEWYEIDPITAIQSLGIVIKPSALMLV